jgi:hypothetical protein
VRLEPLVVLGLLLGGVESVDAQAPTQPLRNTGRIVGVYDDRTGTPLDSVEVRDMVTGSSALTTSTGTVALSFVDSAGSLLRFRKLGYTPLVQMVTNSRNDPPLTITLQPLAQVLPKVITVDSTPHYVSPALRGFEERRKSKIGQFIPEHLVRKNEDRTLGNVIKGQVRGLDVREVRDGSRWVTVAVAMRNGKPCPVDLYLDGLPVSLNTTAGGGAAIVRTPTPRTGPATNDLNDYLPKNLAAIEYHTTATVPAQFNRTSSGCGVLLLWSRER